MNELKLIDEFRKVLADYQPSETAKLSLAKTRLALLVGPTSAGRNTIINELVNAGDYRYIVSDTTRKPRVNNGIPEQNGREYWFRTEEEILADLQAGNFLEAAIIHNQQVSGISIRELTAAAEDNKIAINEIEVVGADNIFAAKPDAIFIFILPPSFDEWMVRMKGRGELPPDEVRRRLESAANEIAIALDRSYYHLVVNDTFKHAARHVDALCKGTADPAPEADPRQVATQLIRDIKAYLALSVES